MRFKAGDRVVTPAGRRVHQVYWAPIGGRAVTWCSRVVTYGHDRKARFGAEVDCNRCLAAIKRHEESKRREGGAE
jgi:hypothetical protein